MPKPKPEPSIPPPRDTSCSSCNALPISNEKSVKISEKSCPCQVHKPAGATIAEADRTAAPGVGKSIKLENCECKKKSRKRSKNSICECPEEQVRDPGPELYYDPYLWIDEKETMKMKSDLTQTTSGFKFDIKRRRDDYLFGDTWSFEDALKYFADHPEEADALKKIDKEMCACDGTPPKKNLECECPEEVVTTGSSGAMALRSSLGAVQELFNGIRIRIEGKGSGSKGLDGILCFELLYDLSSINNAV